MARLILVHGWGGSPDGESWFEPLKKECEVNGIEFVSPAMPNTNNPKMGEWVSKLREVVGDLNGNTCFVGHSMGCQTIIRYLAGVEGSVKIGRVVFVAPWTKLDKKSIEEEGEESVEIVKSWIDVPINFEKARNHMTKILAIFSDDDPYVPLSEVEIFKEKLGAEIVVKKGQGHFNETKEIKDIMGFLDGKKKEV